MNNEQFVASLTAEQNTALLAFRDSINAMHAEANSALVSAHAEQLKALQSSHSELQSQLTKAQASTQSVQTELDTTKVSLATAESRIAELLAGMPWDVRVIDAQAFVRRLSSDEMLMLFSSSDATTQQIAETIKAYVANDWPILFDSPEFGQLIGYLVQSKQITEQRAAEITRDSTREESYVAG